MKKKLAFFTDSGFWSHKPEVIKELSERYCISVYVFLSDGFRNHTSKNIHDFCSNNKIQYKPIYQKYRARSLKNIVYFYKSIIVNLLKQSPDIVYAESFGSPFFLFLLKIFIGSSRVIIGIHDYQLHQISKNKVSKSANIYQKLYTLLFKRFHFFSEKQRKAFKKENPKKKTYVVRLFLVGSDYEVINNIKKERNSFLFFGRIQYYKGVDILIEAVNILVQKRKDFSVVIAGATNNIDYYKNLLTNDSAQIVDLKLRYISREEIPFLFAKASFFIAPYREVTQSGPLMMAYNYKLIPVTSDDDGFLEYIMDETNGFVFKNGNPKELASVLDKICNLTDIQYIEISKNLRYFISQEFDIKVVGDKYEKMFLKLIDN